MFLTDQDRIDIANKLKQGVERKVIRDEYGIGDPTVIDKIRSGANTNPNYMIVKWVDLTDAEQQDLLSRIYYKKLSLNAVSNGWAIDPHSIKNKYNQFVDNINKNEQDYYYRQAIETALNNLKSELEIKRKELDSLNFKKTEIETSITAIEASCRQFEQML